jgi:hypothetical protein
MTLATLKSLLVTALAAAQANKTLQQTTEITRLNMVERLKGRSKYQRHQGERECARRIRRGEAEIAF